MDVYDTTLHLRAEREMSLRADQEERNSPKAVLVRLVPDLGRDRGERGVHPETSKVDRALDEEGRDRAVKQASTELDGVVRRNLDICRRG